LQYGLSSTTLRSILEEIFSDLITSKHIHNWDERLFKGLLKAILRVVHILWGLNSCALASLIAHSTAEEILSISANTGTPSIQEAGDVGTYLFFTKDGHDPCHKLQERILIHLKSTFVRGSRPLADLEATKVREPKIEGRVLSREELNALNLAHGRIV